MELKRNQKRKRPPVRDIRDAVQKELSFLNNLFSLVSLPTANEENDSKDFEMIKGSEKTDQTKDPKKNVQLPKRASNIAELQEKLAKLRDSSSYNMKNKLLKKSLKSKIKLKMKKMERKNKVNVKPTVDDNPTTIKHKKEEKEKKVVANVAKPIFNTDGKLVFSKFDFANIGQKEKTNKTERDPKKILENMEKQKEKFKQLHENEEDDKVKEIKEKMAWKSMLQKAEGQKVKDDPTLLKKSIKRMEQKKKQSKKQWDNRVTSVSQKKEDRQKKRQENISKKKKEKKTKIVKASAKRGRVVI